MGEYHIGAAIKNLISKSNLKNGIRSVQIEEVWQQIMGNTISKYTESVKILNGTLFINTSVGPLKNELLYQKEKIMERVNEAMGEKVITNVVVQ